MYNEFLMPYVKLMYIANKHLKAQYFFTCSNTSELRNTLFYVYGNGS
jgi:hypothetical protein